MDTLDNTRQIIRETEQRICDQRIKRLVIRLLIAAFAWFVFVPENWETLFWPISAPLAWVADTIPSIGKMAAVSPMPGAVRGVLASSAILAPIAGIIILLNDCIGVRVKAFAEGRSFFRIAIAPFAGLFGVALFGGFMFWLPFVDVRLSITPTKGQLLLTAMLTNRLFLAGGALLAGAFLASMVHIIPIRFCNLILVFINLLGIGNRKHG